MPRAPHLIALLALAAALAGCAAHAPPPQETVNAWIDAVQRDDPEAAWDLLDEGARQGMTRASFDAFFKKHRGDLLARANQLQARADQATARVEAQLPLDPQHTLALRHSDAGWRLASVDPDGLQQHTPRDTLASFVGALDARDLDTLLALMSEERRVGLLGELDDLREQIARHLDQDLVTRGDRAVLQLDGGDRLLLVRRDGRWHIESLERKL